MTNPEIARILSRYRADNAVALDAPMWALNALRDAGLITGVERADAMFELNAIADAKARRIHDLD